MIKEIQEHEIGPFFELMGEIEDGRHFDGGNPEHVAWLADRIQKHYGHGTRFWGLYDGEKPVGIVGLLVETGLHTPWGLGYVTDLGVVADSRGKGYGAKLMEFATEEAARQNCYCVYVDTYAGSAENVRFYVKCGYVPVATLPDANGPGDEGQVWLRKLLR